MARLSSQRNGSIPTIGEKMTHPAQVIFHLLTGSTSHTAKPQNLPYAAVSVLILAKGRQRTLTSGKLNALRMAGSS